MTDYILDARDMILAATDHANKQAKDRGVKAGGYVLTVDQTISIAQAAAILAIAERMRPQFVQVGPVVFDPADISAIDDLNGQLQVYFKARHARYFYGAERAAFLKWWNAYANVVRLDDDGEA